MALNSIERNWTVFSEMVFDGFTPPSTQRDEMKRRSSLVHGPWSIVNALEQDGEPNVPEDQVID